MLDYGEEGASGHQRGNGHATVGINLGEHALLVFDPFLALY